MDAELAIEARDESVGDLRRAQAGDAGAFERIYRANAGKVFALCARMTGDRGMAEELTQETFVKAWQSLGSFRGECALGSWLHKVAANVVVSEARSRMRRLRMVVPGQEPDCFPDSRPARDPLGSMDIERAMAKLPEGARTAFVLHDVHGFSHGEIAEMTGQAEGTSKAQLHRARRLLREVLG